MSTERAVQLAVTVVVLLVGLGFTFRHKLLGKPVGGPCLEGDGCRSGTCLQTGLLKGYCSESCATPDDCPPDFLCAKVSGQRYCKRAPTKHVGEPCEGADDCVDGVCLVLRVPGSGVAGLPAGFPGSERGFCSRRCAPTGPACPDGSSCEQVAGHHHCVSDRARADAADKAMGRMLRQIRQSGGGKER